MSAETKQERIAAHLAQGDALTDSGNFEGAASAYQAAYALDVTSPPVLLRVGRSALRSGDLERARKCFRALLLQKIEPSSGITKGDLFFYLGDIAAKEREPDKAIPMLERAIAEDRGHPAAAALLATLRR
jgi:golgin subfamily B member 1